MFFLKDATEVFAFLIMSFFPRLVERSELNTLLLMTLKLYRINFGYTVILMSLKK